MLGRVFGRGGAAGAAGAPRGGRRHRRIGTGAGAAAAVVTILACLTTRTSRLSSSPYSRFTDSSVRSFLFRSSASAEMKATSVSVDCLLMPSSDSSAGLCCRVRGPAGRPKSGIGAYTRRGRG